jgi:hypothetical protein
MHPTGRGQIIRQPIPCTVEFRTFCPIDTERYPYAIFWSKGQHNHPPPPPTKAPHELIEHISSLLVRLQTPDLTPSKLSIVLLVGRDTY